MDTLEIRFFSLQGFLLLLFVVGFLSDFPKVIQRNLYSLLCVATEVCLFSSSQLKIGKVVIKYFEPINHPVFGEWLCVHVGAHLQYSGCLEPCLSSYFYLHKSSRSARVERLDPSQLFLGHAHSPPSACILCYS